MRFFAVITICISITPAVYTQTKTEVDMLVQEYFKTTDWSGVVGFVTRKGSVLYSYGYEDKMQTSPVSQHTPFYLASVTKSFIGLLLMEQIMAKKIAMTDTLGKWFPEMAMPLRRTTIAQLANHTAAIHDYHSLVNEEDGVTNQQVITLLAQLDTTVYPPGTKWGYSNSHYVLLAEILRKEAKQPLETWLNQNLTNRFRMQELEFITERPMMVPSYDEKGRPVSKIPRTLGDAGLVCSGDDMLSQAEVLITDPKWPSLMKEAIKWGEVYDQDTSWVYTFGWFCSQDSRGKFCAHSGQGAGFQTYHRWYYDRGQYYFIMSNRYDGGIKLFRNSLSGILID